MYEAEQIFLEKILKDAYSCFAKDKIQVSEKAEFDVVTNVDKDIESFFRNGLSEAFPCDRILGEEYSSELGLQDRTWILDPIDGTFNFSVGSSLFGLQAAFWDKGELQLSAIYLPAFSEYYAAKKGEGAYCNNKRIQCSQRAVKNSMVSFGDLPHTRPKDTEDELRMIRRIQNHVSKIRMFGAASIDFAYLASGKIEGVVLFTKNKWDLAPGILLALESGAKCFAVEGGEYHFESRGIVSCNREEIFNLMNDGEFK